MQAAFYRPDQQKLLRCLLIKRLGQYTVHSTFNVFKTQFFPAENIFFRFPIILILDVTEYLIHLLSLKYQQPYFT